MCLNRKINSKKHVLTENELKKLQTFDSSYFLGKSHFEEDDAQTYLVFQPICRYFIKICGVYIWNLKVCLIKGLILLLPLIMVLLQN